MTHPVQQKWCKWLQKEYSQYFKNKKVLDIGSMDINGNNKYLFDNCIYHGLDVIEGKNVDIVSIAHEYTCNNDYDVVLSTNTFEHDMFYYKSIKAMYKFLKSGGFMFFSAASKWKEHGTLNTSPTQSATSKMNLEWANYYKNVEIIDILPIINELYFTEKTLRIENRDLQFWGIKK